MKAEEAWDFMTQRDFWRNSKVAVIGAGSWGSVLANLAAPNCREVRLWTRSEEQARSVNATRLNASYWSEMRLHERIRAVTDPERAFRGAFSSGASAGVGARGGAGSGAGGGTGGVGGKGGAAADSMSDAVDVVIWALPSSVARPMAREFARFFRGHEILLHATKGIEAGTLKRVSEILKEEVPCPRIGVISGPNLADEIARGEPAATVIASHFKEVIEAGQEVLTGPRFRVYGEQDVIGVEWAGTLKNILAIASGAIDALKLGWNTRATLITRGLAEMVRFGVAMGADESTFLGLAGVGDLLATCSSPKSRNYRVGFQLGSGRKLDEILANLGSTAEGVGTTDTVHHYAVAHGISMPITEGVYHLLRGDLSATEVLHQLMTRPLIED
jgi:glycerol-3-phosphate dehydrogenase (NAD(P)+)